MAALAAATRCPPEKAELDPLAEEGAYQREVLGKRVSVLELLERFASCELGFGAFLEMLPPAQGAPVLDLVVAAAGTRRAAR